MTPTVTAAARLQAANKEMTMTTDTELTAEIDEAGAYLRDLVNRVQIHINDRPEPEVPHSTVTNPGRWASIGMTDLQTGLMALKRAVAPPTSF